jgi:hypothetical protein
MGLIALQLIVLAHAIVITVSAAPPPLISAASVGDESVLRIALESGADPNEIAGGESPLTALLASWHRARTAWPTPLSARWIASLDTLLKGGASPAVLCPFFDAVAQRNAAAFGAMAAVANETTLMYCLTARKGGGGGILAHHIARSPSASVSRLLFRALRSPVTPDSAAELAAILAFRSGLPSWTRGAGGIAVLTKAAIEAAAGAPELDTFEAMVTRAASAAARAPVAHSAGSSALRAAALLAPDAAGASPLETACAEGRTDVAVWLARHGGAADPRAAVRCVHAAAARGYGALLSAIIQSGSSVPLSTPDAYGRTPCEVARGLGLLGTEAYTVLRDAGACKSARELTAPSSDSNRSPPRAGIESHRSCPQAWHGAGQRGPFALPSGFDVCSHVAAGWRVASSEELRSLGLPSDFFGSCGDMRGEQGVSRSCSTLVSTSELDSHPSASIYSVVCVTTPTRDELRGLWSEGTWCPVDELSSEALFPSAAAQEVLARNYLDAGRPFLVASALRPAATLTARLQKSSILSSWESGEGFGPLTRAALLDECGDVEAAGGEIPLAEAYSRSGIRVRLRDFVDAYMGDKPPLLRPPYIFDTEILKRARGRGSGTGGGALRDAAAAFHAALVRSDRPAREQLGIGPPLSGAPPHFHRAAVNVVLAGVKLWAVWPPSAASYVDGSAVDFWRDHLLPHRTDSGYGASTDRESGLPRLRAAHYLFFQGPGDVVYLPSHWGHATLNLADVVGVALE